MGQCHSGTAPHTPAVVESGYNYARGAYITTILSQWFGRMGYRAVAKHNRHYDLLMVPLAVDAGLGELGRQGYLIADKFGPRIQLFAVQTDMPLVPDLPVDLGAEKFYERCFKCAESCPSRSIPRERRKTVERGLLRWKLNDDSYFDYFGIDPASLSINKITCAGEPGAGIPSTKKRIEEAWEAKVFDHAGATEIGAWSFECADQPHGMHVNEGLFLVEIEDLETGKIIEEPGYRGKMIITALDRQAQPCVRFDSKDIIEWDPDPCSCGRTFRLIKGGVVGRSDDITKVKGVLLAPSAIEEVVRDIEGLGDEFEVVVDKMGDMDRIALKVELLPGTENRQEEIEGQLVNQLRNKTNLRYNLSFHEYESLPRYEVKAKWFKDLRKTH